MESPREIGSLPQPVAIELEREPFPAMTQKRGKPPPADVPHTGAWGTAQAGDARVLDQRPPGRAGPGNTAAATAQRHHRGCWTSPAGRAMVGPRGPMRVARRGESLRGATAWGRSTFDPDFVAFSGEAA